VAGLIGQVDIEVCTRWASGTTVRVRSSAMTTPPDHPGMQHDESADAMDSSIDLSNLSAGTTIGPVRVDLALDASLVRIARLVGSGMAALAGADVDAVEDVRMATDEIATTCLAAGSSGPVTLTFTVESGTVVITAKVPSASRNQRRLDLTDEILALVMDECRWIGDGEFLRCRAHRRILPAGGPGA
jgi:hypothetical protein